MSTHRLATARSVRGMTLLEVLAAVFCLGMGLIMVAGAFPAGAHQTRQTIERTDASQMAKSAMEYYVHLERSLRHLTQPQWKGDSTTGEPMTIPLDLKEWCVWNPERLGYLENFQDSKMLPPGGGDFIMRGFLTRISAVDEAPLFRLTVVVARYSNETPDFYDAKIMGDAGTKVNPGTDSKYPPGLRYLNITGASGLTVAAGKVNYPTSPGPTYVTGEHFLKTGDYIMETSTGLCYPVTVVTGGTPGQITLGEPLLGSPKVGRDWFIFRDVIGVFYRLVS